MTDVIFYEMGTGLNRKHVLEGFKQMYNIPNVGDIIRLEYGDYEVVEKLFDFTKGAVQITVKEVL